MKYLIIIWMASAGLVAGVRAEPDMVIKRNLMEMPESVPIPAYSGVSDLCKFRFIVPQGDPSVEVDKPDRKITFNARDNKYGITFQITTNFPGALPKEEALKEQVGQIYPEGQIFQTVPAAGGLAFDVSRVTEKKVHLNSRICFIPFKEGTVQITFTTESKEFWPQRSILAGFLGSIRIDPL